jgi:maltooligosyltrehalose trehalohydrolase
MLFMGEEYGEPAPFQYFVSHEDAALIEAVRKGRKKEFARFHWAKELPDPQDERTFAQSKVNWQLQNRGKHKIIRRFYEKLFEVRATIPALRELSKSYQEVTAFAEQSVLIVRRWSGESQAIVAFHFGDENVEVDATVPKGRWQRTLDSGEETMRSDDHRAHEGLDSAGNARISLGPWRFALYTRTEEGSISR